MKHAMHRTSNPEEWMSATSHADDYFPRLCSLAITDALSAEEWEQLERHLLECEECRSLLAQYEAIAATTLPALAAEHHPKLGPTVRLPWSMESAETALFARIEREYIVAEPAPPKPPPHRRKWSFSDFYHLAATLVVGLGLVLSAYYLGLLHGDRRSSASSQLTPSPALLPSSPSNTPPLPPINRTTRAPQSAATANLQRRLHEAESALASLREQQTSLTNQLASRDSAVAQATEQSSSLQKELAASRLSEQSLETRLTQALAHPPTDPAESASLRAQLDQLSAQLEQRDQDVENRDVLLQHDRDIRDLIGARDLYIGEIYDVAKTGKTQTPTGRVFYTKGKSLVFYAYDLDKGPGAKLTSTFQAWGRRGMDERHDVNLGIFYQDTENKQRWVLKSHDPATLSQLDAVFVTIEPHGESRAPTGKPLLFTLLRLSPNHP